MTDRGQLATALQIVDAVRTHGIEAVARNLARRKPDHVVRLAATLAALVPTDKPVSELLEWLHGPHDEQIDLHVPGWDPRLLKPCGTHAAYERHRKRGEFIDDKCREGERAYQRSRRRRERAA